MDKGVIYIAVLDNSANPEAYNGEFPVIVKTKKPAQLFSENNPNVLSYGEIVFNESTAGDGMIEFTINLQKKKDGTPAYILLTASASKGGDYFVGGRGSTMWLDDLELVY